jgi:hypothetical protein
MGFEPLDGIKLLLLMAAGLIFCIAGLYLLIRPKPEGSAAKIELFGLKFESSSAGLLVFLIGAGFLAVPMFVPEKAVTAQANPSTPRIETPSPAPTPDILSKKDPSGTSSDPAPVAGADIKEVEPNDRIQQANMLTIGATAFGRILEGDVDWYIVSTAGNDGKVLLVKLRHVAGRPVQGSLYDHDEETQLGTGIVDTGAKTQRMTIKGDRAFLKVENIPPLPGRADYEVTTRIEDLD